MSQKIPRLEIAVQREEPADESLTRVRRRAIACLLVVLFVAIPALSYFGIVEPHTLTKLGRYLCFAIAALGIDLIWGYTGVLSLCHALFFCLGGYAIAMHLSLPAGGGDVRPEYNNIPQFFFFNNIDVLPAWWEPFASLPVALIAAFLLPALVSGIIGFFIFRNRVRGVYFSIITQALAWGAFLAFSRNEMLLGGTNGLTNFFKPLNSDLRWIVALYLLTCAVLVLAFLACRFMVRSRLGRVLMAVRDNEARLYFLGYRPDLYKAFAFVMAALLGAAGGMLYVPQTGIITPSVMRVEESIWMVIWVAVGGRGKLWGAMAGALIANFTYSALTSDMPTAWPFIQAGLFLGALAFPGGVSDLWTRVEGELRSGRRLFRPAIALLVAELFLIADKLNWFPLPLTTTAIAGVRLKYWLALILVLVLLWGRVPRAAIPLLGVSWFVLTEALGLMPSSLPVFKYVLVLGSFAVYAVLEGTFTAALRRLSQSRSAGSLTTAVPSTQPDSGAKL